MLLLPALAKQEFSKHMNTQLFLASLLTLLSGLGIQNAYAQYEAVDAAVQAAKVEIHPEYLRLPLKNTVTKFSPDQAQDAASIEVTGQLFVGLTRFSPRDYRALPALATEWAVSEDGLQYEFRLRPDAVWSDGQPITAADVVWTLRHNVLPSSATPNAQVLYVLKNAREIHQGELKDTTQLGVRALDQTTVVFTLTEPTAYFPILTGLWPYIPLPSQFAETRGDTWATAPDLLATSGPYQLKTIQVDGGLILEKNQRYFEADKVRIPELHYQIVPDNEAGVKLYERNELDVLGGVYLPLPRSLARALHQNPKITPDYQILPLLCTEFYGFNTQNAPMDNSLVRKAISAAIKRALLVDFVLRQHLPAYTFTPFPIWGAVPPEENIGIQFNIAEAKVWLADAGYPNGEGLPTLTLAVNDSEQHVQIGMAIQLLLKSYLNIDLELKIYPFDEYLAKLYDPSATMHMFRMGWCGDYPDPDSWLHAAFHPSQTPHLLNWHNEEFNATVEKARAEPDADKRRQLYWYAEHLLVEQEAAVLPLYYVTSSYLIKPWVKGWYGTAFGGQAVQAWSFK